MHQPLVRVLIADVNGDVSVAGVIRNVQVWTHASWVRTVVGHRSGQRMRGLAQAIADADPRIRIHHHENVVNVGGSLRCESA